MNLIVASLITLGVIGIVAAVILYVVAPKFKVEEDPRIGEVEEVLPGANCGGCGHPGCHGFAEACAKAESLDGLLCPVGGIPVMTKIGAILGMAVAESEPKVAVLRCNGSCANRPRTSHYDGAKSCRIASATYAGETDCAFGCVGFGDCEAACMFDALHINPETGLPEIDDEKCTACGACVKACPKNIIELRKKGPKNRRVWVSCVNKDKGAAARKACAVACIGCGKCAKVCPFDAITVENNLAYIDFNKCRLCRKCVAECPTGAIHEINFPPRPAEPKAEAKPVSVEPAVQEVKEPEVRPEITMPVNEPVGTAVSSPTSEICEDTKAHAAEETRIQNEESTVRKTRHLDATPQTLDI